MAFRALQADQARRIAELAREAESGRADMLDMLREDSRAEQRFLQGDSDVSERLGLDALPQGHPARQALSDAIRGLSPEAQQELRALDWIGRGTYAAAEWDAALSASAAAQNTPDGELMGRADLHDALMKGLWELRLVPAPQRS